MRKILFNVIVKEYGGVKRRSYYLCLCIESRVNYHKGEITYDSYFLKGEGNLKKSTSFLIPSVLVLGAKRRLNCKKKHLVKRLENIITHNSTSRPSEIANISCRES